MSEMNQGRQYDDIIIFVFQKHFLYVYGEQTDWWPVWIKLSWLQGNYDSKSEGLWSFGIICDGRDINTLMETGGDSRGLGYGYFRG